MSNSNKEKTLFSRMVDGEIPCKRIYEDDVCIAIHDIQPQAPVHILLIPKEVIPKLGEMNVDKHESILGHLMTRVPYLTKKLNIHENFRVVINNGVDAGQTVFHLHIHILGGRPMKWPPG